MVGSCPAYGRDPAGGGRSWAFSHTPPLPYSLSPSLPVPQQALRRLRIASAARSWAGVLIPAISSGEAGTVTTFLPCMTAIFTISVRQYSPA